jgi:Holliday junction DNA helicase RuvB
VRKKIVGPGDTVPEHILRQAQDDIGASHEGDFPNDDVNQRDVAKGDVTKDLVTQGDVTIGNVTLSLSKGDPEQHAGPRIVGTDASLEDEVYGATLRPRTFADYVGQEQIVDNLRIAIDAAARRGEPLEHVLFSGPPGLGKTTLANLIARATGGALRPTSGPTLEKPKDLVGILTSLDAGDVLFIDEIHRLGTVVEEYLYPAMEDFQIDFIVDRGAYAKNIKLPLKRFTLVGATTRAGMLSAPLRDRFGIVHHLAYYEPAELQRIAERSARVLDIAMDTEGARTIAQRSRGTPRVANRLLRRVRDFAEVRADGVITAEVADEALRREGVDARGLDRLDRAYLDTIANQYGGGPVGINAIAATLTEDVETLEDVVEPYLLKIGFVQRTAQGRKTTPAALAHLGLRERKGAQQRLL